MVNFPPNHVLAPLGRVHARSSFRSGEPLVDDWLATKALQHQEKHLSTTKILLGPIAQICGYYTLAANQVDFPDLPAKITRRLPRRNLPVAVIAWLGVSQERQGEGLGELLLAQALNDCHEAGKTFAFVAVVLDCLNDSAKRFYERYDFEEIPGRPYKLFLSVERLASMMS